MTSKQIFDEECENLAEAKALQTAQEAFNQARQAVRRKHADLHMQDLPAALQQGTPAVINWLDEYFKIGLSGQDLVVAAALKNGGYEAGAYTNEKFVEGDKEILGRWMIGSVVSCIDKNWDPENFWELAAGKLEEYRAMATLASTAERKPAPV